MQTSIWATPLSQRVLHTLFSAASAAGLVATQAPQASASPTAAPDAPTFTWPASPRPGSLDGSFNVGAGLDASVFTLAEQADGRVLIGGFFSGFIGVPRTGLARLNPDGTLDETFAPVLDDESAGRALIWAVAVQPDGKVLVGGQFHFVSDPSVRNLARFRADGTLDAGFSQPGSPDNPVHCLALQPDGKVLIGGAFEGRDGIGSRFLARLLPDGRPDPAFVPPGLSIFVDSVLVQPDGRILIQGGFENVGGQSISHVARLNPNGALDSTFNLSASRLVSSRAVASLPDGRVLVAGHFAAGTNTPQPGLIRCFANGQVDPGFHTEVNAVVDALALQPDGKVLLGGSFTDVLGALRRGVARLNADGGLDPTFDPGAGIAGHNDGEWDGPRAYSLLRLRNGNVLLGGNFTQFNGAISHDLARLIGDTMPPLLLGGLRHEIYTNIPGNRLADLTNHVKFPARPDRAGLVTSFETPSNSGDLFGARLSGFLLPPLTGDYVFYIASDDQGALFLSPDVYSSNKLLIAWEPTWSPPRQWTGGPMRTNNANVSAPIRLEAGRCYYVEALMKEGGGGDNLAVAWQPPGEPPPANGSPPISGEFLAASATEPPTNLPPVITQQPASVNLAAGQTANFTVQATGTPPLAFRWLHDGDSVVGATNAALTMTNTQSRDWGEYRVVVSNAFGSVTSATAILQLWPLVAWGDAGYGTVNTIPSGLTSITALAAGSGHALAVNNHGAVVAWPHSPWAPVPADLTNAVAVSAGTGFSVALRNDGTVSAWGWGWDGETNVPPGLNDVVALDSGGAHTIALRSNGTVVTWGFNPDGRNNLPPGLCDVVAVSAGSHNLVLKADGTVVGWGWNGDGQADVPPGLSNVVAVAAGYDFSVALKADGTVRAWGNQYYGQDSPPPDLSNVVAIAAGYDHALALRGDGTVVAWGNDYAGAVSVPSGLNRVISLAAGGEFESEYSLVLRGDGSPVITVQPVSRTVNAGEAVTFTAFAVGQPPLRYQWLFNGQPLAGATQPTLSLPSAQLTNAGRYTVTISNALGFVHSRAVTLAFWQRLTLADALDDPGPWTTDAVAGWFGQNRVTHDGTDAAQSGVECCEWTSYLSRPVQGPARVTFWWKIQSAPQYSSLICWVPGTGLQAEIRGDTDWQQQSMLVPAGEFRIEWSAYFENTSPGSPNAAWVDQVAILPLGTPPTIVAQPASLTRFAGECAAFTVVVSGDLPLAYQWQKDGLNLPGQTNATLTLDSVRLADMGDYRVRVSNAAGSVTSAPAHLEVLLSLAEALDAPGLTWTTSDESPWFAQTAETHDGVDSAQAGFSHCELPTWLQTTVSGPGTVSLRWKMSYADGYAPDFSVSVNNGDSQTLSDLGNVGGWQWTTLFLPAGTNLLRWNYLGPCWYYENAAAWLDEVVVANPAHPMAPLFTTPPLSQEVVAGSNATFTALAAGYPIPTLQWQFNGTPIPGATNSTLVVDRVQAQQGGTYTVVAHNSLGHATSSALLTVLAGPPVFVVQPATQHAAPGMVVTFAPLIYGSQPMRCQWRLNGANIPDATNATLVLSPVAPSHAGAYSLVASNGFGGAISAGAVLTISWIVEWGAGNGRQLSVLPASWTNVAGIAAGLSHSLAWMRDGTVAAWGNNVSGQLNIPAGLGRVVAIAGGTGHTVALQDDGRVVAWGSSDFGACNVPPGLSNVIKVAASGYHTLALKQDGRVVAWGRNVDGESTVPAGLSNVVAVAAGYVHSLALRADGIVVAWGGNLYGQTDVPPGLTNVVAIGAGTLHSLAVRQDGTVVAWNANWDCFGPSSNGQSAVPAGLSNVIAVAGGEYYSLALKRDGTVVTWPNCVGVPATLTNVVAIAGGQYHLLALVGDPAIAPPNSGFVRRQIAQPDVRLVATPATNVSVYAVEDQPPPGWLVTNVTQGGVFDARTGKVKFGPFFDGQARTLSYELLPTTTAPGAYPFVGAASADGVNSPIGGDQHYVIAGIHPADLDSSAWHLTIGEVTGYGAAWRRGLNWLVPPNPIPIDYVTRAAMLWRNGECYRVDSHITNAPLWWVNCDETSRADRTDFQSAISQGSNLPAVQRQAPSAFVPGEPLIVTLAVQPGANVRAFALEDAVPAGWSVASISHGGEWDTAQSRVKWGPFFDTTSRVLSYQATPPIDAHGSAVFAGAASFDGQSLPIAGTRQLEAACRLVVTRPLPAGRFEFGLTGEWGARYLIEASSDLVTWTPLAVLTNSTGRLEFSDPTAASQPQRFYRAKPAP